MLRTTLSRGSRALHAPALSRVSPLQRTWLRQSSSFAPLDTFPRRHIGPNKDEVAQMLSQIKTSKASNKTLTSLEELVQSTVPAPIRMKKELDLSEESEVLRGENELLSEFKEIAKQNQIFRSFIGMGYNNTITPYVIQRNILENPGWYTPYTPYQAEISQGRLESLLNFQTIVSDLTGLSMASASLLDEGTAAAEAMAMCLAASKDRPSYTFYVDKAVHPQTIDVVTVRAEPIGVRVVVGDFDSFDFSKGDVIGVLVQYPNTEGAIEDFSSVTHKAHEAGALVVAATDLLALTMIKAPGEWGADIALGNSQRFGVPLGYGGPHAAFFATSDKYKRLMPGRIIGVSKDVNGKQALRMALQTREQHIRRERATSNICTAQALLANMVAMYGVYHGPSGIKDIARAVHNKTRVLAHGLEKLGYQVHKAHYFDTIKVSTSDSSRVVKALEERKINVRVLSDKALGISLDEATTASDVGNILAAFASASGKNTSPSPSELEGSLPQTQGDFGPFARTSDFMTHPVFNSYHSEHELLRYIHRLQKKDLGLNTSMIPLGSCTMKLNATVEMYPVSWPEFNLHPFVPTAQAKGYKAMFSYLERALAEVTGFSAMSLQPNAGSQGEYAGLMVIREYFKASKQTHRNVCLIPTSAHGTNPASAVMAGFQIVVVACDQEGNINVQDLQQKAEKHKDNLACLMVTYPSTHGVFEEGIQEMCEIIHRNGGQVYMDGANMNAQVGLCRPGDIGADVCHLNLHKTFCIPHGGGGPGMGPIGVAKHLAPFLPGHSVVKTGGSEAIGAVSAAPWSSASILPITYVYLKLMGGKGLREATTTAILSANYMAARLKPHYKILYTGSHGLVAHEFIIDLRAFKESAGIESEDVAKRLQDYGFHGPTMSWPVVNTLMIEPTESESKQELDRLTDALISIRQEIRDIEEGKADRKNNVLKNAPHPLDVVISDKWDRPYTREQAAFPTASTRASKFWPTVGRVDNVYGDRNLVCSCPPLDSYAQ